MELADEQDAGVAVASAADSTALEVPVSLVEPDRGPRPAVTAGLPIAEYTQRQLVALASWVMSDTLLRTDDELLRELRRELGFSRGGSRINAAILEAIAVAHSRRER